VNPVDPQSWNRYAYLSNRPLNSVDPLGLCDSFFDVTCGPCDPSFDFGCQPFPDPWDYYYYCEPSRGRDGSSSGGGGGSPVRIGGKWPNGETLGLPTGLNLKPMGLAGLIGLSPGNNCDWVCVPIGSGVAPGTNNGVSLWGKLGKWFGGSAISISSWLPLIPIFVPVNGVPVPVGSAGLQFTTTYIPQTYTLCGGLSGGVAILPGGKGLSGAVYPSPNAKQTKNVVSSLGWSLSGQVSPGQGYSVLTNSSGTLWGYSVSDSPGIQATYGYTGCKTF
jgi:hypothetical protein